MLRLPLSLWRAAGGKGLGEMAVEVPFHIVDDARLEDLRDRRHDVVLHLRPREVKHELMAAEGHRSVRRAQHPVGMRTIEVAVLRDHLRLEPEAEFQPAPVRRGRDALDAALELFPVDRPVAERGIVVVPMAEPAVVEHEELEPEIRRARSERVHLLVVEVEIRRLPVVDEDRAHRVAVFAAQEMLAIRRMERLRHSVQPVRRVDADDFRRLERLSRRELPGEIRWVQPRDDARRAELLHLRLHREAAAVNQAERINLPGQLSRLGAREREER